MKKYIDPKSRSTVYSYLPMLDTRTKFLILGATLVALILCSCTKQQPKPQTPPVDPQMASSIRFRLAVYLLKARSQEPSAVLRRVLSTTYPSLKLVSEIPKDPNEMFVSAHIQKNVHREYTPPSMHSLQYSGNGLSPAQAQALQNSQEALILEFGHAKDNVWVALQTANALVEEIARKTGGLIWDEETREIFSPDAWHEKRLSSWEADPPNIATQTVIHIYQSGEYARAITLGMSKVGLPDVVIQELPWSSNDEAGNLINAFCQFMAENEVPGKPRTFKLDLRAIKNPKVRDTRVKSLKPNALGQACLSLKPGRWEEGDPKNRLIELASDRYAGNDVQAKQEAMLSSLFGWEDAIHLVRHNQEVLEASRKARTKLPELREAFNDGLQPGEYIQLKAPFEAPDGGNEWMWVEVTSWKNDNIKGLLENEPFKIPNLHSGQGVEIQQKDVFDYIRQYSDGRREGNTTGVILQKMDQDKSPATQGDLRTPSPQKIPNCDSR